MNIPKIRERFVEICQDFGRIAAGYNYMISDIRWREYIGNLQASFTLLGEKARGTPEDATFPHIKQTRIDFFDNLERGVRLYYRHPEILFELVFVYMVQEWQIFLNEISQGEYESGQGSYCQKLERVKQKLGIGNFPHDLEWKTRLYVEVRNNLQHSRRKLRKRDLDRLGVKEFELIYNINGIRKKYKVGDTVVITAATVFEAAHEFIKAATKLVP